MSSYKAAYYFPTNIEAFDSLGSVARAPRSESTKTNSRWDDEREKEFRDSDYHVIRLISRSHLKLQVQEYDFGEVQTGFSIFSYREKMGMRPAPWGRQGKQTSAEEGGGRAQRRIELRGGC